MQPAPHVLPGWGPHEGGNGSRDAPGRGPTGTRRETRKAGLMRSRAARVGPPPGREVCVPSAPARGQTHPGLPTPEGRSPSTQRGDGGAVWAASDWRSRREGRRPGLGSARSAQPGLPARWGGGAARPGSGRLPRPGPAATSARPTRSANLGCGPAAGTAAARAAGAAEFGEVRRRPRRAASSWAYLRAPGPVRPAAAAAAAAGSAPASARSAHMDFLRPRPAPAAPRGGARGGGAAGRLKGQRAGRARAHSPPGGRPGGLSRGGGGEWAGPGDPGREGPGPGGRRQLPDSPERRPPELRASAPARGTGSGPDSAAGHFRTAARTHSFPGPAAPARTRGAPAPASPGAWSATPRVCTKQPPGCGAKWGCWPEGVRGLRRH